MYLAFLIPRYKNREDAQLFFKKRGSNLLLPLCTQCTQKKLTRWLDYNKSNEKNKEQGGILWPCDLGRRQKKKNKALVP